MHNLRGCETNSQVSHFASRQDQARVEDEEVTHSVNVTFTETFIRFTYVLGMQTHVP
jgi:hypothetical protein